MSGDSSFVPNYEILFTRIPDPSSAKAGLPAASPKSEASTENSVVTRLATLTNNSVFESVVDVIGSTPMVSLSRLARHHGIECGFLAKLEFVNPGGSVKDRIARRMVDEALRRGDIRPGDTLIEATSGNTGVGMAMVCAARGLRLIVTMPEKMSMEKQWVLESLGAKVIRTPTAAAWNDFDSHISVAYRLLESYNSRRKSESDFRCVILDQYKNLDNPLAHYYGTAEEILQQTNGNLDAIVMTAGTGGTVSGVARKIKERLADKCRVVAVDPVGSILYMAPDTPNKMAGDSYQVEGIGYDFHPSVLEWDAVDEWARVDDKDSFLMAQDAMKCEGLLLGGSSGTALAAAVRKARTMKKGQTLVVLLPDSARNYTSKFVSQEWRQLRGFQKPDSEDDWFGDMMTNFGRIQKVSNSPEPAESISLSQPEIIMSDYCVALSELTTVYEAMKILKKYNGKIRQFILTSGGENEFVIGMICKEALIAEWRRLARESKSLGGVIDKQKSLQNVSSIQMSGFTDAATTAEDLTFSNYFDLMRNVDHIANPCVLFVAELDVLARTDSSCHSLDANIMIFNFKKIQLKLHQIVKVLDQFEMSEMTLLLL